MRNGLNITGVSESVHEYRDNPEEAVSDFRVVTPLPAPGEDIAVSRTLALRDGTYRIARDFTLRHRLTLDGASGDPTPAESMLAAVAACVLTTKINGFTSRGVSLNSLRTTARARLPLGADGAPAPGAVLDALSWSTDIDCDAPTATLRSINELVGAFSPNHQSALDSSPVEVTVTVHGPGGSEVFPVEWAPASPAETDGRAVAAEADVVWEDGSESAYTTSLTADGVTRTTDPLVVDQAKQMLGIDKGPNSQEILLAALTAEVAGLLRRDPALIPVTGARLYGSSTARHPGHAQCGQGGPQPLPRPAARSRGGRRSGARPRVGGGARRGPVASRAARHLAGPAHGGRRDDPGRPSGGERPDHAGADRGRTRRGDAASTGR